jgi:hypothetical protein
MGGMAAVFRARQTSVNRHVAIKLIPADGSVLNVKLAMCASCGIRIM